MKKNMIMLLVLALLISVYCASAATFEIAINAPQDGVEFQNNIPIINVSTGTAYTNCTFQLLNFTGHSVLGPNNLLPDNSISHQNTDVNISSLPNGLYNISVFCMNATDSSDNTTNSSVVIGKDITPPSVVWNSPSNNDNISESLVVLNVTISDYESGLGIGSINFTSSCGGEISNITCNESSPGVVSAICNATWNTSEVSSASCTLNASVNDRASNINYSTINVNFVLGCGEEITSSSTLTRDITGCSSGLTMNASDIIFDCNGHSITGDGTTDSIGIIIPQWVDNVTIRNCNVSNFDYGISVGANDSLIENNNAYNNTETNIEIYMGGSGTVILNNTLYNASEGLSISSINLTKGINVTRNTIINNNVGVYIANISSANGGGSQLMVQMWYNDIYDNTLQLADGGNVAESSYASNMCIMDTGCYGNFWGHTDHCPYFRISDTNFSIDSMMTYDNDAYNYSVVSTSGLVDSPECTMCGDIIDQGDQTLTDSLYNWNGTLACEDGLTINSSDMILDCAGYSIVGTKASESFGVQILSGNNNVTIRNCTISGFVEGIYGINLTSTDDINVISNTLYDNDWGISLVALTKGTNSYVVTGNNILNTSSDSGIHIWRSGNAYIDSNIIYDTSNNALSIGYSDGTVSNNLINDTPTNGISVTLSNLIIDTNNVSFASESGIKITASSRNINITNNNVTDCFNALNLNSEVNSGFLIYHNNFYDSTNYSVVSDYAIELSNGTSGNFWGHNSCPVFSSGVDSNAANVMDSHPYNSTNGWLTGSPTYCVNIDSFVDTNSNTSIYLNYDDCYTNGPCSINFLVNVTNSSAAGVNLTHGGICMGVTDPQPMAYGDSDEADFNLTCIINSTALGSNLTGYNITAGSYLYIAPSYLDEIDYTVYSDFEVPRVIFDWWNTTDTQGDVTLPHYKDFLNESDIFFSPVDNTIYFKINATDNGGVNEVYVDFTLNDNATPINEIMAETGGDCNETLDLILNNGYWIGNCDLGTFNETMIENWNSIYDGEEGPVFSFNAQVYAVDNYGNEIGMYNISFDDGTECIFEGQPSEEEMQQCMPALTPILMHDIGVMGPISVEEMQEIIEDEMECTWGSDCEVCGPDEIAGVDDCDYAADELCMYFDESASTNLNNELNFSNIDFSMGMKVNVSCMAEAYGYNSTDIPNTFETMMTMNLSGIDFNSQETATKLAMLPDNIDVQINMPGAFGNSRIFVNSSAFEELNTTATIKFFHLPFTSEPFVDGSRAAGVSSSSWQSFSDSFWNGMTAGNLTLQVNGFSDYEIIDTANPVITSYYPNNESEISYNDNTGIELNAVINGTGTQLSYVGFYLNGELNQSWNGTSEIQSGCTNLTADWDIVNCSISGVLSPQEYNFTIIAYDYGGEEPGNSMTQTTSFNVTLCGATITKDLTLTENIICSGSNGINIGADDVTLDCAEKSITYGTTNAKIGVYSKYNRTTIQNCIISGFIAGLYIENSSDHTIISNDVYNNYNAPSSGIYLFNVNDSVISDNNVYLNDIGIHTKDSYTNIIQRNMIYSNNLGSGSNIGRGIYFESTNKYNTISSNTISNHSNYGVYFDSGSSDNNITSNVLVNNTVGMHLLSNDNNLRNNNLSSHSNNAINASGTGTTWYATETSKLTDNNAYISGRLVFDGGKIILSQDSYIYLNGSIINTTNQTLSGLQQSSDTFNDSSSKETEFSNVKTNITFKLNSNKSLSFTIGDVTESSSKTGMNTFKALDIQINDTDNLSWAIIKMYYNQSELDAANIDPNTLKIYFYNESASPAAWEEIASDKQGVDTTNNYVWANVTHFSTYGAFGTAPTTTTTTTSPTTTTSSGGSYPTIGTLDNNIERSFTLRKGYFFNFILNKDTHKIKLNDIDYENKEIEVTIESDPVTLKLKEGEKKTVDIDGDGIDDIMLWANTVTTSSARITIKQFEGKTQEIVEDTMTDTTEKTTDTKTTEKETQEIIEETPEIEKQVADDTKYDFLWIALIVIVLGFGIYFYFYLKKKK